ncbi:MAG: histidine kinase [Bacillota bacterium]
MNKRITELERRIDEIKNRLPAHSVKPSMIEELEELEEELAQLKERIEMTKKI